MSADPIAAAVQRLLPRARDIAGAILESCGREVPAYTNPNEALRRELLETFTRQAATILQLLASGSALGSEDIAAISDLARRRLEQGFAQHDVERAYNIGIRVGIEHLTDELQHDCASIAEFHRLSAKVITSTMASAGIVSDTIARAYLQAGSPEAGTERSRRDALEDLLTREESAPAAARCLSEIGLTPATHYVCAVVEEPASFAPDHAGANAVLRMLRTVLKVDAGSLLVEPLGSGLVVLLAHEQPASHAALVKALAARTGQLMVPGGAEPHIGVGRVEAGPQGIRFSYQQAQRVLHVLRSFTDVPSVMTYEQALPYLLVDAHPETAMEITRVSIAPLLVHDQRAAQPLLPALRAYLQTAGRARAAAKLLNVHPRTLRRRLDLIEHLTGASLDGSHNLLLFALGVLAAGKVE